MLFTYDLPTENRVTLHNFTLQEISLQIALQRQQVHSAKGQAGAALIQCATGDIEDLFTCRNCRRNAKDAVYKTNGNLQVK